MSQTSATSLPALRPIATRRSCGLEHEQALRAVAVAQDEKRRALALGLDALAQLGRRRGVGDSGDGSAFCIAP